MRFSTLTSNYKLDPGRFPAWLLDTLKKPDYVEDPIKLYEIEKLFNTTLEKLKAIVPTGWDLTDGNFETEISSNLNKIDPIDDPGIYLNFWAGINPHYPAEGSRIGGNKLAWGHLVEVGGSLSVSNKEISSSRDDYVYLAIDNHHDIKGKMEDHYSTLACQILEGVEIAKKARPLIKELHKALTKLKATQYIKPHKYTSKEPTGNLCYDVESLDWFLYGTYNDEHYDAYICAEHALDLIKTSLIEKSVATDIGWGSSPFTIEELLKGTIDPQDEAWCKKAFKKNKVKSQLEYVQKRGKEATKAGRRLGYAFCKCEFCGGSIRPKVPTLIGVTINV